MKYLIIASIAVFCSLQTKAQQEPHYTQNQFNSNLLLNPAYAGSDASNTNIGLRYRNQWVKFAGAPTTYSLIAETKWKSLGIGLSFNQDIIGIEKISTPDLNLSYHLPLSNDRYFSFGFKGGMNLIKTDFTKLVNVMPGDPLYAAAPKVNIPFIGFGMLYYTPKFYFGLSSPRTVSFESPTTPRSKIAKAHYFAYGGARIKLENGIELRPAILAKYQSQAPFQLDLAFDTWYQNIVGFGVGYRTGDAVNFMLKSQIKKMYIGYSYDMNISRLNQFNKGSHEIFLGFKIPKKAAPNDDERNNSIRYF